MSEFGAELYELYKAGANVLPSVADIYREIEGTAANTSADQGSAMNRSATKIRFGPLPLTSQSAGHGPAYESWQSANQSLQRVLDASAQNIEAGGNILLMVTFAYAAIDEEAADHLTKSAGLTGIPVFSDGEWE